MIYFLSVFHVFICAFGANDAVSSENDFMRIPFVAINHPRSRRAAEGGIQINLWNPNDLHYGFPITVGTPPQQFVMNLDTGSSDVWVPSVNCESPTLCNSINKYNASASSTHKAADGEPTFSLGYAVGGLSGLRATEVVTLGGLTINNQIIGEALKEPTDSYNYPFDGTFGFGWSIISATDQSSTPLDNLFEQKQIAKRLFCIKFTRDKQKTLEAVPTGGELSIGGCDVEADYWRPLSVDGFWQIKMTKLEVGAASDGGKKLTLCENGCEALFDTGMGPIGGPPDEIDLITKQIGAHFDNQSNYYVITPCDLTTLPNVDFQFDEVTVTLTPDDYVTSAYPQICFTGFSKMNSKYQKADYLLGDPFLRALTVIYDKDNKRLGFANIKNNPK